MNRNTVLGSELLWRRVRSKDGRVLGRVYDLVAERVGFELRVTALLVGRSNTFVRFGWSSRRGQTIPWERIERLEPDIVVRRDGDVR